MNHIEQLHQTLEEMRSESEGYRRLHRKLDELLQKINQAGKFDETLEQVEELTAK